MNSFFVKSFIVDDKTDTEEFAERKLKRFVILSKNNEEGKLLKFELHRCPATFVQVDELKQATRTQLEMRALKILNMYHSINEKRMVDDVTPDFKNQVYQRHHAYVKNLLTRSDKYSVKLINRFDMNRQWYYVGKEIFYVGTV